MCIAAAVLVVSSSALDPQFVSTLLAECSLSTFSPFSYFSTSSPFSPLCGDELGDEDDDVGDCNSKLKVFFRCTRGSSRLVKLFM